MNNKTINKSTTQRTTKETTHAQWMIELKASLDNQRNSKKSVLDINCVYILALKKLGFTWDGVADEVNRILDLKGDQITNGRMLSLASKKWREDGEIEQKVDKIVQELLNTEQRNVDPNDKEHKPIQEQKNVVPDTYNSIEEFTADVMKSPDQRFHNKDRIAQAFNSSKGKPKKEMLNALRDIVLKSMGNV
ncbi:hypothetical protein KVP10_20925 [Candidimonas humi]|uniref:Uncharacterized protein n=1 Tax=Candidimonas humi TaxID=683355 RepID=A0ABV8P3E2_9BURK|nr:hypothetical protein [Candidimonas humi]MBV6307359.1 hypothetical protein [Candidimonas humi]